MEAPDRAVDGQPRAARPGPACIRPLPLAASFRRTTRDFSHRESSHAPFPTLLFALLACLFLFGSGPPSAAGAELAEVRRLFVTGDYAGCAREARAAIEDGEYAEEWRLLLAQSLMARGDYPGALEVVSSALNRYSTSIRLKLLARTVFQFNNDPDQARSMLSQINYLGMNRMWAYRDPENMVALGRAALWMGADPRKVLEQFYDRAIQQKPELRDAHLASGQLALDKGDYQVASRVFAEGLKKLPDDPDLHYGLARAFAPSDRRQMLRSIMAALEVNTNHTGCYLLLADHLIDTENYDEAADTLGSALRVNPWLPEAWALHAVLAHLNNDEPGERLVREVALSHWPDNPEVDHLIGRKLSQKYRFAEGAASQRRALARDPSYLPAKIQLAQDLMRLGDEAEGWHLAEEVHERDAYDVTAFNLVTLKEGLDKFRTLTNADFILRMGELEAAVYGEEALALLQRAKDHLCAKYGMHLERPTVVEIFPDQRDFGVRTFGMPHNPGFLGVCFGSVITANSPASQGGRPNNWEAVLWHEFCHVVTLQMTRNKMPRWLSEGISVYEELKANPTWGQRMTPEYREMILEGELTPLSELSAAFLTAQSDLHMQFAYYESYLAVEFLVSRFGLESLRAILRDLGRGEEINDAIARHTAPMETLEPQFEEFVTDTAKALGPGLSWDKPDPGTDLLAGEMPEFLEKNSKNYYVLLRRARRFLEQEQWQEAKAPLRTLIELYPDQAGPGNAYALLAMVHRHLEETAEETDVLKRLANQDADAIDTFSRLMELADAAGDWDLMARNARRYLAVNPMVLAPQRHLARASEALEDRPQAIRCWENCLHLEDPDPARAHYRLGKLLRESGRPGARLHVLKALEEAPRFRDAQGLLLELHHENAGRPAASATPLPPTPAPPLSMPTPQPKADFE